MTARVFRSDQRADMITQDLGAYFLENKVIKNCLKLPSPEAKPKETAELLPRSPTLLDDTPCNQPFRNGDQITTTGATGFFAL